MDKHLSKISNRVLHQQALEQHQKGDLRKAEKLYREAIKRGYSHPGVLTNLGVICKNTNRYEDAMYFYEEAIKICPEDSTTYNNIANLHLVQNNANAALKPAQKAVELDPNNAELPNNGLDIQRTRKIR